MKTVKITPPEGFEIDKENSTFEEIVFKPVSKYPTKLEEIDRPWFITPMGTAVKEIAARQNVDSFNSKERAEEVLALIQLLAFRDAVWEIDGWKPDWTGDNRKHVISVIEDKVIFDWFERGNFILAFKTTETRDWFLKTHRELIEKAQNLL